MSDLELTGRIPTERLPGSLHGKAHFKEPNDFTEDEINLLQRAESILNEKIEHGEKGALFQLGQLNFQKEDYASAKKYFEEAVEKQNDMQALFQLGIMHYDALGVVEDFKLGMQFMATVGCGQSPQTAKSVIHAAQFNIGRGYFQGFGVPQSDSEAERWWLLAADDGNPKASVRAQTTLGFFYSRRESKDLKKAFFWHSEACGNGSLESQGALGVMYLFGLGVKKNLDSAFECLREATERGNVYAMGHLVTYYYDHKLFTKASVLGARAASLEDIDSVAEETECLPAFISKGIALAAFYYARCLHYGYGVIKSEPDAQYMYSKACRMDLQLSKQLQLLSNLGKM